MKKLTKDFSFDKFWMVMPALHLAATSLLGMLLVNPAWAAYEFYFTDNLTLHQYLKLDAGGGRGGNQQWADGAGPEWRFANFAAVGSGWDDRRRATIALTASGTAYAAYTVFGRATADAQAVVAAREPSMPSRCRIRYLITGTARRCTWSTSA